MNSLNNLLKVTMVAAVTAVSGAGGVANAQSGLVLEELVVTARKVEESIQDIPVSITAFSAEQLKESSIEELEDVALLTPGLTFEDYSNGGFGTPVIRGASQFNITQLEQNVSTFYDGVYIPRQYAVDVGTLNLERVEVVKGPQTALYGANAFAGAINYVSKAPDLSEFLADVSVTAGSDERFDASVSVSVPLVADKVALRFAGGYSEFDGDWENEHPDADAGVSPGTDGNIGGWEKSSYQLSLAAQPSDNVSIDLNYSFFDTDSETRAISRLTRAGGDTNCSGVPQFDFVTFSLVTVNQLFCGEFSDEPVSTTGGDGFVADPRSYGLVSETEITRFNLGWDVSESVSLNYQFANIAGESFSAGTSDRDPLEGTFFFFPVTAFGNSASLLPVGDFDYDSHELRLEFNADNGIYAMAGVYSSEGSDFDNTSFGLLPFRTLDPITEVPSNFSETLTATQTDINAIFARVQIPLLDDRLVVSLEGRYTEEEKLVDNGGQAFIYEDDYFTPRISIDYSFNENQLIYTSVAQGVKSGGVNGSTFEGLLESERFYDVDENTTYEIGTKNILVDGALQLNASVFLIDWSDLQVSQTPTGAPIATATILTNLGAAESKGIEVDLNYKLSDSFSINAGLALIDATYDEGTVSARIARNGSCDDIVCNSNGDVSGNELARSADTQWNLGGIYTKYGSNGNEYFIRADLAGQSEQFVAEQNTALIPSRTLLNLRAGIGNDVWSAELWIKNAMDEEYVSNSFYIANPFQAEYVPTWGNRRRIGVTVDYSF